MFMQDIVITTTKKKKVVIAQEIMDAFLEHIAEDRAPGKWYSIYNRQSS